MLALLMLSITLGHYLKKSGHKYLQEAGLTTIIGILAGAALKYMDIGFYSKNLSTHFNILFMILMLPPIIFEAGYNLDKKPFFRNFGTILAYSFTGTFLSIICSSLIFYATSNWIGWQQAFSLKESFAFGSLISATDPVSVLAIFKEMDADANLYSIVFGESIFNDAIGIVMFETVKDLTKNMGENDTFGKHFGRALGKFLASFFGSLSIGASSALVVALILKRKKQDDSV